ncbi:mCG148386 [Mus musculus]|nr:mCG148386 [Mus musculus]
MVRAPWNKLETSFPGRFLKSCGSMLQSDGVSALLNQSQEKRIGHFFPNMAFYIFQRQLTADAGLKTVLLRYPTHD